MQSCRKPCDSRRHLIVIEYVATLAGGLVAAVYLGIRLALALTQGDGLIGLSAGFGFFILGPLAVGIAGGVGWAIARAVLARRIRHARNELNILVLSTKGDLSYSDDSDDFLAENFRIVDDPRTVAFSLKYS